jgi:L-idonate 5-dehydrogenase
MPTASGHQVLLRVEWGGICGSDLSYWKHGASGVARLAHPLVLGHEIAGVITAVGDGVDPKLVGRSATVHPARPEPAVPLPSHLAGRDNLHPAVRYLGSAALRPHTDGGFQEYVVVDAAQVRPLPVGVDTMSGALAEPLAVALHAVTRVRTVRGRSVLVNGAGAIGALVVAALRQAGAGEIVAADISTAALETARRMGANATVDLSAGQPLPEFDLVFEASGARTAIAAVLAATTPGGTIIQVGNLPGGEAPFSLGELVSRELTWRGSFRFVDEITTAVALLAQGLDVSPIITHRYSLASAVAAFETAASTGGRVMLDMRASAGEASS